MVAGGSNGVSRKGGIIPVPRPIEDFGSRPVLKRSVRKRDMFRYKLLGATLGFLVPVMGWFAGKFPDYYPHLEACYGRYHEASRRELEYSLRMARCTGYDNPLEGVWCRAEMYIGQDLLDEGVELRREGNEFLKKALDEALRF